jgi:hypothetical protein
VGVENDLAIDRVIALVVDYQFVDVIGERVEFKLPLLVGVLAGNGSAAKLQLHEYPAREVAPYYMDFTGDSSHFLATDNRS